MNTVMDDNKVLTLVSNERVPLSDGMRMLFEIDSLANATPATVSRAGILYLNESDVGWRPMVDSWVQKREREVERAHLPGMFDKYIERVAEEVRRRYKTITPVVMISGVTSVTRYMDSFLEDWAPETEPTPEDIEHCFVLSMAWAFGGALTVDRTKGVAGDYRRAFHDLLCEMAAPNVKFPKEYEGVEDALCFDFYYNREHKEYRPWSERVEKYVHVPIGTSADERPFDRITVQTVDSIRVSTLMDRVVKQGHSVMLVGTAGTGKSTLVKNYLNTGVPANFDTKVINANYFMDSKALQSQLDSSIDKRSGRVFGPPTGRKMVIFVDDLNLPYIETYGTQNSLSLLRQAIDHGSFFDRDDLGLKKELADVQFISAMNPTAGSFKIAMRLQRQFTLFATLMPSDGDLQTIYQSIMDGHFRVN